MRISKRLTAIFGLTTMAILPCHAANQPEKPMMKAVVIHAFGGLDVLKVEDVSRPGPKEDEVLIRVIAASINPVDAAIRQRLSRPNSSGDKFPLIPGMDAAGVVEKAGAKMSKFKAGDPVYAFFTLASEGGYARVRPRERGRSRAQTEVTHLRGGCGGASGRLHGVEGADGDGQFERGTNCVHYGGPVGSATRHFKSRKPGAHA